MGKKNKDEPFVPILTNIRAGLFADTPEVELPPPPADVTPLGLMEFRMRTLFAMATNWRERTATLNDEAQRTLRHDDFVNSAIAERAAKELLRAAAEAARDVLAFEREAADADAK